MPAENLYATFHYHPVLQAEQSHEEGRPIYKDEVYVQIQIKGQKNSIFSRKMRGSDKVDFPRAWAAFQEEMEEEAVGTPISTLPGVGPSVALELKALGVKTIEDMAGLNDAGVMNVKGGRMLQQRAKAYLAACEVKPEKAEKAEKDDDPVDVEAMKSDPKVKKAAPRKKRK